MFPRTWWGDHFRKIKISIALINTITSKTELEPADYDSGKKTAAHYMKWVVEDGTNITVNGNVSIYSRLNANGQYREGPEHGAAGLYPGGARELHLESVHPGHTRSFPG